MPPTNKSARSQIVDEQGINIGPSDSRVPNHGLNAPVKRVKFAEGSPHAQLIFSVANAVLYQQEIYSKDNIAIFNEPGKCVAHINIAIGRTPICRCNAGDEFDGFYLTENIVPVSARWHCQSGVDRVRTKYQSSANASWLWKVVTGDSGSSQS